MKHKDENTARSRRQHSAEDKVRLLKLHLVEGRPISAKQPLAPNIACLDFCAGLEGPLVAYRWDGERELDACKMIVGNHH